MNREKQRNRFWLACFFVVFVPLLLGSITYSGTCSMLRQNALDMNRTVLESACDLTDMKYEEIDALCSQLYIHISNSQILHTANLSGFDMQMKKMELVKSMAKLMQGVNSISAYYLYLKPLDAIVTEESVYTDPALFYTNNMQGDAACLDAWLDTIRTPSRFLTARAETFTDKLPYRNGITFYRSFPFVPYDKPQGCIVLTLPRSELEKPFKPLEESGSVYRVVDQNGHVLLSSGDFPVPVEDMSAEEIITDEQGDQYAIVSMASPVCGWRYDVATNTTKLFSTMSIFQKTYWGVALGILLLGIIISVVNTVHVMKPVNQILDRNSSLEITISQQSEYLSANLWEKLLAGELSDEQEIRQRMDMSGLSSTGMAYVAIDVRTEEDMDRASVEALTQRLLGMYAYQPKASEIMLCVPLQSAAVNAGQLLEQVRQAMEAVGLKGRIGMGKVCDSLTVFYQSYFEAETALTYARATDQPYARYEDVGGITEYLRPIAGVGEQLIHAVMSGQMDEVTRCLKHIREECFEDSRQGYFIRMQVIYELRHMVIRCTSVLPDEHELDQELLSTLSRQSIREHPQAEFENLCTTLLAISALREQELNREKPKMKSNDMIRYICDHYQEPQLSLCMAAEHFRMNEAYFSTYFKQNTGVSFTDYLQQLRIDRAIDLIRAGEMRVSEIAQAIGYSNDQNFRRAFKRVIGVSPTAYRNACFGLQADKEDEG